MKPVYVCALALATLACGLFSAGPGAFPTDLPSAAAPPADTPAPPPTGTAVPPTPAPAEATSFPDSSAYHWAPVVSGLDSPVDIQFPPDGSGRMFVLEQAGRIRVVVNGQLANTPFLDITGQVGSRGNEQGLLGLAFHPRYAENGNFYVNYTDTNGNTVIARFHAQGDAADPASESVLLRVDQPFANHNGGVLAFGPDGYLYAGLGDGGAADDPFGNGQKLGTLLGKILRIDLDHGDPYTIPADNPFGNEIWAYGLRNPWRISFDSGTGDLYIADVGQDVWEEIDFSGHNAPGLNYGWKYFEGSHAYIGRPAATEKMTYPVAEYSHNEGGCSVTGGYVYRGAALPEWLGIYLYGDYCTGKLWGLIHSTDPSGALNWRSQLLFETGLNITTFGRDPAGEIYVAGRNGTIYRLGR